MQARVKAGWITEADLAPQAGAGGRSRGSPGGGRVARAASSAYGIDRKRTCWQRLHDLDLDQADRGPRDAAAATERMCVATRTVRPVGELIRFVAGPDGLVPDLKRRLPGRGVWVTARRSQVEAAVKRRGVSEEPARRREGPVRPCRYGRWAAGALRRSMPCRSPTRPRWWSRDSPGSRRPSPGGRWSPCSRRGMPARRGPASSRRRWCGAAKAAVPVRNCVVLHHGDQLDLALGRLNVVHAALLAGRAVETFLARWRILECFRAVEPDDRNSGSLRPNQDALEPGS